MFCRSVQPGFFESQKKKKKKKKKKLYVANTFPANPQSFIHNFLWINLFLLTFNQLINVLCAFLDAYEHQEKHIRMWWEQNKHAANFILHNLSRKLFLLFCHSSWSNYQNSPLWEWTLPFNLIYLLKRTQCQS